MKWGILCRWQSWWVGAHWSPYNKRLCVNLIPLVTVWFTVKGGVTPEQGFTIYRSDREEQIETATAESHARKVSNTHRTRKGTLMNCPIHAQVLQQYNKEENQRQRDIKTKELLQQLRILTAEAIQEETTREKA